MPQPVCAIVGAGEGLDCAPGHVRLDCDLDVPLMRDIYGDAFDPEKLANTADVVESYWWTHQQPKSAWTSMA